MNNHDTRVFCALCFVGKLLTVCSGLPPTTVSIVSNQQKVTLSAPLVLVWSTTFMSCGLSFLIFSQHCMNVRQMLIPYSLLAMSQNTLSFIAAPVNRPARSPHSKLQVGLVFHLQTKFFLLFWCSWK